jgi:SAM-dependent methyltransferase
MLLIEAQRLWDDDFLLEAPAKSDDEPRFMAIGMIDGRSLAISMSPEPVPLCPVTGRPAVRRVQWVTTRLLADLWRIVFRTDALGSFAGIDRIGLWESPTGLYFFDPPVGGDQKFYSQFHARLKRSRLFTEVAVREEFLIAARHIQKGARVLDLGCGYGNFRQCVPQADYTGLDPHVAEDAAVERVRNETLTQHLAGRTAFYDAVCCFQVIEHVRDPKALFAEIVQAAKPGGLVCIGVPHVPSALTRIPNFLINAPPHHLTWWSKTALVELAASAGAIVESIDHAPWGREDSRIFWIERCSPIKCADIHFRGALSWHAAALIGHGLGSIAFRLFGAPKTTADEGGGLLMFARRQAG